MSEKSEDEDGIDYAAEGSTPPSEKKSDTDAGYDEAAHSGASRFGVGEGAGGVFGTTGGGTYEGGMHVVENPEIYDRKSSQPRETTDDKHSTHSKELENFDHVSLDSSRKTPGK